MNFGIIYVVLDELLDFQDLFLILKIRLQIRMLWPVLAALSDNSHVYNLVAVSHSPTTIWRSTPRPRATGIIPACQVHYIGPDPPIDQRFYISDGTVW